jgi:hypothetical protein
VVENRATVALPQGQMAYMVVTAFNTGHGESQPSKEFVYFAKEAGVIHIPAPVQNINAPPDLNAARIERSTDLQTWVPIYFSNGTAEFFRLVVSI